MAIIRNLKEKDKNTIVRLAIKYPPATKALLGALLDELQQNLLSVPLYKILNPITKYKLAGEKGVLGAPEKRNII